MAFSVRKSPPILPIRSPIRAASSPEAQLGGSQGGAFASTASPRDIARLKLLCRRNNGWNGSIVLAEAIRGCFYALVVGIVFLVAYATLAVEVSTQPPENFELVDGGEADIDCNFQEGQIYGVVVDNPAAFIDSAKDHVLYFDRQPQQLQLRRSWGGGEVEKPLLPFYSSRVKVCRIRLMPEERELDSSTQYAGVQFMWSSE